MGFLGVLLDDELETKIKSTGRPRSDVVRDALRAYFDVDQPLSNDHEIMIREIERLLDAKIGTGSTFNPIKCDSLNQIKSAEGPPPSQADGVAKPALNQIKSTGQEDDIVKKAAHRILEYFDLDVEPTAQQIADDLGVESRPLGKIMSASGLQARNVRRGGKMARRYTFEMREKIEAYLDSS